MQWRMHMIYSKHASIALTSLHACDNGSGAYAQLQNACVNPTNACFKRVHKT